MRLGRRGISRLFIFLGLTVLLLSFVYCGYAEENLLYNGDFEILDADGMPDGWVTEAYRTESGYSVYSVTEGMDGSESHAVTIRNNTKNDARFAQTVSVEPETVYCLSGYILAGEMTEGHLANLSVEGVYAFSERVAGTDGQWRYIEYYGETGPDQRALTVFARVGGYSGESKGSASFDHLMLTRVDSVPGDVYPDLWYTPKTAAAVHDDEDSDEQGGSAGPAWPFFLTAGILYGLLVAAFIYYYRDGKKVSLQPDEEDRGIRYTPLLVLALGIRMAVSYFVEGYSVDVNCFVSWGSTMRQAGPVGFYQATSFCDYPPLYMYILGANSWLASILGADAGWTRVIFRFFPSLCDVAGCWILMHLPQKRFPGTRNRYFRLIILLAAFNPAAILNSAAWGQMDSVLCLLLLCVAIYAIDDKWIPAIVFYVTAVLVKPQALMLGVLGLLFMVITAVRNRKSLTGILIGAAAGVVHIVISVLPFGIGQDHFGWLISRYGDTLTSYPYATVNTANLYYITGGNWSKIGSTAQIAAPLFLACACLVHGIVWYCRNRTRRCALIELAAACVFSCWFAACAVFSLSWTFVGTAAMAYAFVIVLSMAVRKMDIRFLPYLGALLFILLYVFGVKMHERYLFPAFMLLLCAWAVHKDRRILYLLLLFTLTVFVNEGVVLDNCIRFGAGRGHLNEDTIILADILSILNIAGAVFAVILGYALMNDRAPGNVRKLPTLFPVRTILPHRKQKSEYQPDNRLHWTIRDTAILCGITLVFAAVSLTTLGSTKAPQTAWTSSGEEEQIVFDLGEVRTDVRVLYFGQARRNLVNFTVAQSTDGETWSEETLAQMEEGQCWKWKYVTQSYFDSSRGKWSFFNDTDHICHFSGRYLRITSQQVGLVLNEIIFRDPEGNPIPAVIVSRTGNNPEIVISDPENLLDEQDTIEKLPGLLPWMEQEGEAQPSWWNSTYFDEIYHARTGFEFVHAMDPYETSHPPLGKVFISWCISIFGMTPFGWRFAGALAGILMLPGIYLLAKQLTKKTWAAAFACLLMAFDCMHLTQTQIATIDSFPVLFIIFAFFFMLRFIQTDLSKGRIFRALVPLAFSGLNMGLAIASKWIGIYAGIGLAVLYFGHCIRQIRMYRDEDDGYASDIYRRVFVISLWCLLFFIAVPLAIYLLSYIPYLASRKINGIGAYLAAVWRSQQGMLSYHSTPGLGMDHPFYSPWWEWPIIGKPMFYATEQYIAREATLHHSIFSFGNPAVWWVSLGALAFVLYKWAGTKRYRIEGTEECWHLSGAGFDIRYGFVFIGLLAQYLPWVLVPRGTYIYHYFASIPFLILACVLALSAKEEQKMRTARIIIGCCWITAAAALFIILLPYATGMASPKGWLETGRQLLRIWY